MDNRKRIKIEKQQLILKLVNLFESYKSDTEHREGEKIKCELCQNIQAWTKIIEKLDKQLQEIESDLLEKRNRKKKSKYKVRK